MICVCQAELKKEAVPLQDDSDLEKKRREAEALLQSMGITSDVPVGRSHTLTHILFTEYLMHPLPIKIDYLSILQASCYNIILLIFSHTVNSFYKIIHVFLLFIFSCHSTIFSII